MSSSSDSPIPPKTFVVLAAYNEQKHVGAVVRSIKQAGFSNIIVVNDGSRDATAQLARDAGARVISKPNGGKGSALRMGCDAAVQAGARKLVLMDADGQHRIEDVMPLLEASKEADLVIGSRKRTRSMPFRMRFGNWFLSTAFAILHWRAIQDTQSGMRVLNARTYKTVRWNANGYAVEVEMLARAARHGVSIAQAPIATIYHDPRKGTNTFDGFPVLWTIILLRFRRL